MLMTKNKHLSGIWIAVEGAVEGDGAPTENIHLELEHVPFMQIT